MHKLKTLIAGLVGIVLLSSFMAPREKKDKIDEPKRIYMYGVSVDFNDSIIYMTDIQYIDSMIVKSDGSLHDLSNYSIQMKYFLEGDLGESNQTCAVVYSDNKKKLEKRYVKTRKKYQSDKTKVLMKLNSDSFTFRKE